MFSLIKKWSPWLLPTVLVLFILEMICLPFVIKYTWPSDKPTPEHTLTYTKNALSWDSGTIVDPATGAAKLNLFSEVYGDEAQSDNGDHIIAPGLSKETPIRIYNSRSTSIIYWAALYYKKSTEDIPIVPDLEAEHIFGDATSTFKLPNEITAQGYEMVRAYYGYVDGRQKSDLNVKWDWPFEDPDDIAGRDAIDTELGNRAAQGDFENIEVGLYIYIEDHATGGGGGFVGGGGGGGGSTSTKYTVEFNTNGGSEVASQQVTSGKTLTKPEDPTKEGYVFDGWYVDSEFTTQYDFDKPVTSSFTLYAKWVDPNDPGTDEPGTDEPGTDEPGTDEPGTDEPGTDEPGTDTPGTDEPGTDTPGTDKPGTDTPSTDEPGTYEPGTYDEDDVIITHPDGTITYPEGKEESADGTVTYPDGTVVAPDGTITHPDGTVTKPGTGSTTSDGTVIYPDGTIVHKPDVNPYPNATITHPDGTITYPAGTVAHPSGVITYPDGTIVYPDGIVKAPNGTISKPAGATTTKHGTVLYPNGTMLHPWSDPIFPNAEIEHPDGTYSKPQGGLIYGGGVMVYTDGTVVYPDGIIRHPDGTYVYPTNVVTNADGSLTYSDGTIVYPAGKGGKPTVVTPTGGTPDTGDSSNLPLFGALIIITLIVLILLMVEKKLDARRSKK